MSHVRRFDHVGLTVADLDVVAALFVTLGLEVEGRTFLEGEFLDTVCGIPDSRTEIVMLTSPGDGARLELARFVRPDSVPGSPAAMANELGLRNGWPTSAGQRGSSSRWASASAEPRNARICRRSLADPAVVQGDAWALCVIDVRPARHAPSPDRAEKRMRGDEWPM